jgi:hypothetical protein
LASAGLGAGETAQQQARQQNALHAEAWAASAAGRYGFVECEKVGINNSFITC